eukprot:s1518_g19.t1
MILRESFLPARFPCHAKHIQICLEERRMEPWCRPAEQPALQENRNKALARQAISRQMGARNLGDANQKGVQLQAMTPQQWLINHQMWRFSQLPSSSPFPRTTFPRTRKSSQPDGLGTGHALDHGPLVEPKSQAPKGQM